MTPLGEDPKWERVRFLRDVSAITGVDLATYGPFKAGAVAYLPAANASLLVKQGVAELAREVVEEPTLKQMFKGEVLTPYVEASRSRLLTELAEERRVEAGEEKAQQKLSEELTALRQSLDRLRELSSPPRIFWHGAEYYAYGSSARPLDWLTIKGSIQSVPHTALVRLSREVDYSRDVPYFNIILSPTALTEREVRSLELTPLEKAPIGAHLGLPES